MAAFFPNHGAVRTVGFADEHIVDIEVVFAGGFAVQTDLDIEGFSGRHISDARNAAGPDSFFKLLLHE